MITLPPFPPGRAWLTSFWVALSLTGGLLTGILLSLLVSAPWFALGVALAVVVALPGLLRPEIASIPYRAWNKLAREFARYARLWLMGVCYYIIFSAVGRTGSNLRLARPTPVESFWVPRSRGTLATATRPQQDAETMKESPQKGWARTYLSWAVQSGNLWAVCLLPFLIMLSALEDDQHESHLPASIYTLF